MELWLAVGGAEKHTPVSRSWVVSTGSRVRKAPSRASWKVAIGCDTATGNNYVTVIQKKVCFLSYRKDLSQSTVRCVSKCRRLWTVVGSLPRATLKTPFMISSVPTEK